MGGFRKRNTILLDAAYGVAGGIMGTLAMTPVTSLLYKLESREKREKEDTLRRGDPSETFAIRMIEFMGLEVTEQKKKRLGQLIHWGYGAAWGALYGVLRRRVPVMSKAGGLLFGVLFFLVGDELMNGVMGLTPPPKDYPIDAHVRGLAGHVVFAAAAEGTIRAARVALR